MKRTPMEPDIVVVRTAMIAAGVGMQTSDRGIARDAVALGKRYAAIKALTAPRLASPRCFVAASSGYDRTTGTYRYAMGDVVAPTEGLPAELERIEIPAGTYAAFTVRPVLGFLWGPAIGRTYAYAYGRWLPSSAWKHAPGAIDHYEHHGERAFAKQRQEIEIRIPVAPK